MKKNRHIIWIVCCALHATTHHARIHSMGCVRAARACGPCTTQSYTCTHTTHTHLASMVDMLARRRTSSSGCIMHVHVAHRSAYSTVVVRGCCAAPAAIIACTLRCALTVAGRQMLCLHRFLLLYYYLHIFCTCGSSSLVTLMMMMCVQQCSTLVASVYSARTSTYVHTYSTEL